MLNMNQQKKSPNGWNLGRRVKNKNQKQMRKQKK